jgi:hypothetical protein
MPFGADCEFADFAACVRHFSSGKNKKSNPRAYCAQLMKATEEHCAKQRAAQHVPAEPPPAEAPAEWPMPPRVGP